MASKRKSSVLDGIINEVLKSVPVQVDEFLSKIGEHGQEIISNAEQEAITIVNEAAQRVEAKNKELEELEEEKKRRTEAMKRELLDWENEKKRIASTHTFEPMGTLNVGGHLFTTATATLKRFPDTMLGAMFSGRHALRPDENGAYCIDRDGRHFHEILNFLRGSTASTQQQIVQRLSPTALGELKVEADFYGLKDLMFPAVAVSITGATGTEADKINGTYNPTDELSGEMPVYVKVGSSNMWLEYHAATKQWMVKPTSDKGKNSASASCAVPAQCLPQECPTGKWHGRSNGNWAFAQLSIEVKVANDK